MIENSTELIEKVKLNTQYFRKEIKKMGFDQSSVNTEENFKKIFNSFLNL